MDLPEKQKEDELKQFSLEVKADSKALSLPSIFSGKSQNSKTYGSLRNSFVSITAGKHFSVLFTPA